MNEQVKTTKNTKTKKQTVKLIKKWSLTVFATTLLVSSLFVLNAFAQDKVENSVILNLTNKARTSRGLNTLSNNKSLDKAAYNKARDMFSHQYFDHVSPQGKTPWDFITASGYDYAYAGENLAIDFDNINTTQQAWMQSPSHRENILDPKYKEMGSASVTDQFNGRTTTISVEMFGTSSIDSAINRLKNLW